uniref:phospholipase D n=1 Tax=Globisporangium ultimum (strain ATCC 200006 / CBS 805.95 / DAOM BR144) TaxID=431595 RepID=K3WG80_GLOUD
MRGLDDKSEFSGKSTPREHFHGGCGAVADDSYSGFQQSNGGTEYDFEEECVSSDVVDGDDDDVLNDGEMTIMNDDDDPLDDDEEEVMEHSISFQVSRATVTRTGLLPCCVFVGRVTWGTTDWEIYFGQKQLLRLHVNLYIHQMRYRHILMRGVHLPWTIWREKRAEKRVMDVHVVQQYIRTLLKDRDLRNSEPLLAFLEVSPSRAMSRYGPSLKEGYVHMRMNGPFQLPLYTCFNRTIETLYRHLYRTWMRISYVSAVVGFIFPLFLIILTNLPAFFSPQKELSNSGDSISTKLDTAGVFIGIFSLAFIVFLVAFIYKFFDHRLGVVRRWVVLKPSCFAAYRNRSDREPSEVFLFDKTFTATKGSYRQGVSWMPSGFVVGSKAGFIEIDTGHYYTRLTAFYALIVVCYGIMKLSNFAYDFQHVDFPLNNAVNVSSVPALSNWTTAAPGETEVDHYCGYFFTVPDDVSAYVRPEDDDSDAVVSQLRYPANDSYSTNANYFWQSSSMAYNLGVISNSAGPGSIISVAKKINPETDLFLETGMTYEVPKIGTLTIDGMEGATSLRFHPISHFCAIPIKVAPFNWATAGRYILLLLLGGIVAPVSGLVVNYIITYLGLWHAHVRRDHWYRCVRRLQKLKRQETEYRYHSFAPARVSNTSEVHQKNNFTSFTKQAVEAAMKSRNVSDSDSSDIDSKGSTQSGGSFSPVPGPPSAVAWHVDGEDTYEAMYKAISNAKYEILIAGWWVCPDLFLLRPGRKLPAHDPSDEKKTNETQLRNLLLLKAQAGVKIHVLIYREVKLALTLNSSYSKRSLLVHPNIRVLRDPIFQIQSLGFWSHHEKIVCVDQSLAFVGGLDLCFGRYDHSGHPLSDPGGSKLQDQTWPGKDYSNPIIKDFVRVNQPYEDLIDRQSQPRMPWHDVHCSVSGPPVQDIAYHFIQRWNFVCSKNDYQLRTGWCICLRSRRFKFLPKCLVPMDFNGWKLRYPSSDTSLQTVPSSAIPLAHTDSCEIEPFEVMAPNPYSSTHSPGFPPHWGKGGGGSHASFTSDVPLHTAGPPLSETLGETEILRAQRGESILQVFHPNAKICNVQVCRSVSMWSAGVPTEASIQEAYVDVISKSKHYIYIENQFFISGVNSNHVVSNRILQALVDRIERAVKANEVFRVYVVMPLLPAFEGNIRSEELTNLHAVMHWQFATISRGKYSLFAALENVTDKPENYVSFFGLRKYGILPNGCVSTEQIYIHSKLMIADDMYAILGSANINDRSMMGDRDSEIALIMEDMQFEDGRMNDQPHRRGVVVSALRLQLFREHLGLADSDDSLLDPASESTWLQIKGVSKQNTKIYENVFDCAPSNNMRAFTSFQNIEISQIYENQRLNVLKVPGRSHVWDKDNLKEGDYAPWTDVNGVPIAEDKVNMDDYVLDNVKDKKKKHLFSMDHDGWLYARNFSIFQEIRTGKTDYKKREKLQHLLTDRLMAQVRRRRWVKKGTMALQMMSRVSSISESDDEEHNRFVSLWRRFQNGEFSRANSLTMQNPPNIASSTSVMSGDASYPNSPMMSSFRRTPLSPSTDSRRDSLALARSGHTRGSTFHGTGKASSLIGAVNDTEAHRDRESVESVSKGLGQSLRKWYSAMDIHDFGGRRSKFSAEYFDRENNTPPIVDEPLLENGRTSLHSIRSGDEDDEEVRASNELGECQIGHVQTAATVAKQDESRARGQLSEIRGHLVEFPLDFLVEEILKPSIMPSDIHI